LPSEIAATFTLALPPAAVAPVINEASSRMERGVDCLEAWEAARQIRGFMAAADKEVRGCPASALPRALGFETIHQPVLTDLRAFVKKGKPLCVPAALIPPPPGCLPIRLTTRRPHRLELALCACALPAPTQIQEHAYAGVTFTPEINARSRSLALNSWASKQPDPRRPWTAAPVVTAAPAARSVP
jgi:hypothetical protein